MNINTCRVWNKVQTTGYRKNRSENTAYRVLGREKNLCTRVYINIYGQDETNENELVLWVTIKLHHLSNLRQCYDTGKYSCQWNRVTNDVTADKSSRIVKYRATHSAQIKTNATKLIR